MTYGKTEKRLLQKLGGLAAAALMALAAFLNPAFAGYKTDAWGDKFMYGAYSTLISSYVLGVECRDITRDCHGLFGLLNDPHADLNDISEKINAFKTRYQSLSEKKVLKIIKSARDDRTPSVYEEERSIVSTPEQNDAFMQGMADRADLRPVDGLVDNDRFTSDNFQFSAHRGLYNNAYGIPQNSLAAIVNAYVAGVRNIEFDVLDTSDHVSVLIHDLVTNRLDGTYMDHPKFIEDRPYDQAEGTAVNVLNPIGDQPAVEDTGFTMITTARVLEVVHALMPEMTLYLDARNDAPLSLIRLLETHPEYRNNVVIKIYPFSLCGGATDVVKKYADLCTQGYEKLARQEIAKINPNVLLAIGHAEMEANQDAAHTGVTDFTWAAFKDQTLHLPFAQASTLSYKEFEGNPVFTTQDLNEIEMRTFLTFRWAMGLTGITNTMVFQMGALPSLKKIIDDNNASEYGLMSANPDKKHKISAAVHDNFITLYGMVKNGDLQLLVTTGHNKTASLVDRIANTKFGISDRFPDFSIARRVPDINDKVDPNGMVNFNYSMLAHAYKSVGYQPEKVRSTAAIMTRIHELEDITNTKVVYATTDLATDLRMAFMGLLGNDQLGLPANLTFRAGGIIKERYGLDPETFALPTWITRLSGIYQEKYPDTFAARQKEISAIQKNIKQLGQIKHDLARTRLDGLPFTNMDGWRRLGLERTLTPDELQNKLEADNTDMNSVLAGIDGEINQQKLSLEERKNAFHGDFGVRFVGERGLETADQ